MLTKEELFERITGLNAEVHTAAMLERIHTKGASINEATVPNMDECPDELKPLEYPFEAAWDKSLADKASAAVLSVPSAIDDILAPIVESVKN